MLRRSSKYTGWIKCFDRMSLIFIRKPLHEICLLGERKKYLKDSRINCPCNVYLTFMLLNWGGGGGGGGGLCWYAFFAFFLTFDPKYRIQNSARRF